MAKNDSKSGDSQRAAPATSNKRELAKLDRAIVKLVNERAKLTQQMDRDEFAKLQRADRLELDENAVAKAVATNKGPVSDEHIGLLLQDLTAAARGLTTRTRITYLGPQYTYSHLAATRHFGSTCEFAGVATISTVFEEVDEFRSDFGVVPLENSTDGRISDTLDMFVRMPLTICGEVKLRINHFLLARCSRDEIREVHSKPQAMSQCRGWLAKNLPDVKLVETPSTTKAAQNAATKPGVAAIASREAGANHGLAIIDPAIQDQTENVTRFAIIGHESHSRTGKDKTSFLFGIAHEPGALADIMNVFKRNRLNLTWIESFPAPNSPEEYLFFVEAHGHRNDLKMKQAIASLEKKTNRLDVLGSYPRKETIE